MRDIFFPDKPVEGQRIGGKATALATLTKSGFSVPAWFAVPADWFYACLPDRHLAQAHDPASVSEELKSLYCPDSFRTALAQAFLLLSSKSRFFAVRSSALEEDSPAHSFAGQLESFLFVPQALVCERVLDVWRSGFSERIWAYRQERGLTGLPSPPAVIVQESLSAESSGVAFGVDPVSGCRDLTVISAIYGLGTGLVSGEFDADTYRVNLRNEIVERRIAAKRSAHHPAGSGREGIVAMPVSEVSAIQPALVDSQVLAIAELARAAGRLFGRPQDIEWAFGEDTLYVLQSRPITSLSQLPDPNGAITLWDNSNIAESYGGITTPLTFSFVRHVYEEVYRQFCHIMLVPARRLEAHDSTFRQMLGLIQGRVYYNLMNWYRVLLLLPGYRLNRRFMEQMMGVKEGLPPSLEKELDIMGTGGWLRECFYVSLSLLGWVYQLLLLPKTIRSFHQRLEAALDVSTARLEEMRADELVGCYRKMEQRLLRHWDAPLINDFFAMIFFGVLRQLTRKWCQDSPYSLHNDLIGGEGRMISSEAVGSLRKLAVLARRQPDLMELLTHGSLPEIEASLQQDTEFKDSCREYLDHFGDRCLDELKLESPTLVDDPLPLFRAVGQLARQGEGQVHASWRSESKRQAAIEKVTVALSRHWLRQPLFNWVLKQARRRVRERENLRFERTRLFGKVRRIFLELGHRLTACDRLEHPRDIFFLEVEEILGFVTGTVTCTGLKGLVALRKQEYAHFRELPAPADRFETRGMVYQGNNFQLLKPPEFDSGDRLQGLGCCAGVVRGPARLVKDPQQAQLEPGDILVAERTDPGWVMIFPLAAGLLVERGSLLSHSAIVARELGIPAIVSLVGLTGWIKEGEWVELDGSSGVVRRCTPDSAVEEEDTCQAK